MRTSYFINVHSTVTTSPEVAWKLSPIADLAWRAFPLVTEGDPYGRFIASPAAVRNLLFKENPDKWSADEVARWMDEFEAAGLIRRYEANGRRCGYIVTFAKHNRELCRFKNKPSAIPPPPDTPEYSDAIRHPTERRAAHPPHRPDPSQRISENPGESPGFSRKNRKDPDMDMEMDQKQQHHPPSDDPVHSPPRPAPVPDWEEEEDAAALASLSEDPTIEQPKPAGEVREEEDDPPSELSESFLRVFPNEGERSRARFVDAWREHGQDAVLLALLACDRARRRDGAVTFGYFVRSLSDCVELARAGAAQANAGDRQIPQARVVELPAVGSTTHVSEAPGEERDELVDRVVALGVERAEAARLVAEHPREEVQQQLDALRLRKPKRPAAVFLAAVREGWELPAGYQRPRSPRVIEIVPDRRPWDDDRDRVERNRDRIDEYLAALSDNDRAELLEAAEARLVGSEYGGVFWRQMKGRPAGDAALRGVVEEIVLDRLGVVPEAVAS